MKSHSIHGQDPVAHFEKLIKGIKFAMLTTMTDDGTMRSRPMATQTKDFDHEHLWFYTKRSSPKSYEISSNREVHLSYASPEDNRFVSVTGSAEIVEDRRKMEELWSPVHKAWFPDGLDDPELTLLKVKVQRAEYWDAPGSRMIQLFGALKAAATGKPVTSIGDHGRVEFGGPTETVP